VKRGLISVRGVSWMGDLDRKSLCLILEIRMALYVFDYHRCAHKALAFKPKLYGASRILFGSQYFHLKENSFLEEASTDTEPTVPKLSMYVSYNVSNS
jgi:hypothetical protein